MPCDIGYKSYTTAKVAEPEPQTFKTKTEAPKIDADLLAKLGEEDPKFLEFIEELETKPLLVEALKRATKKVKSKGVDFRVNDKGMLEATGSFKSTTEKRRLEEASSMVTERWQFELLGIVAELMGFSVTITEKGDKLTLEAEEEGKIHPCDFIKISKQGGDATFTFEHFKSRKKLDVATAKFLALANKLGVKLSLNKREITEGDPFPGEELPSYGHKQRHKH